MAVHNKPTLCGYQGLLPCKLIMTTESEYKRKELPICIRNKEEACRNEIKSAYITREGMTMTEVVELLADEHGWSSSVPNLSGKLRARVAQIHRSRGVGRCAGI